MMIYDYLVVGSGLYGAVVAEQVKKAGRSVLVLRSANTLAGTVILTNMKGLI